MLGGVGSGSGSLSLGFNDPNGDWRVLQETSGMNTHHDAANIPGVKVFEKCSFHQLLFNLA